VSPARRLLLQSLALVVVVLAGVLVAARLLSDEPPLAPAAPQDRLGPVLLVPGYGGATGALEVLAGRLRQEGRTATVVPLPGDGTGDLRLSADALATAADAAIAAGAPSVDVVGYSAGGVVARRCPPPTAAQARRVVTLGSPHDGTELAGLGVVFAPESCPLACQQLAPGSDLLEDLEPTPDGPAWLSLWTDQDTVVTPPDSARLDGAVNVVLQRLCPGVQVTHGQLPTVPLTQRVVVQALSAAPLTEPAPGC
jgi:triacylglycerol lipase